MLYSLKFIFGVKSALVFSTLSFKTSRRPLELQLNIKAVALDIHISPRPRQPTLVFLFPFFFNPQSRNNGRVAFTNVN